MWLNTLPNKESLRQLLPIHHFPERTKNNTPADGNGEQGADPPATVNTVTAPDALIMGIGILSPERVSCLPIS